MRKYQEADALAEAVAFGLFIYRRMRRISSGEARVEPAYQVTVSEAKQLCDLYRWWYAKGQELLAAVEESEKAGFLVEDSEEFREAHRDVGSMLHGISKLRKSIEDFEQGRGRPLKEVFDELRGGAGA
jgi:hypothetical protein